MAIHNYLKFNVRTILNPYIPNQSIEVVQIGPHPIISQGLFDTGCTVTLTYQSVAIALGLKVKGYATVHTANGPANV